MTKRKVVLVTGATSGIGKAIVELLSRQGYTVFGTARNPNSLSQTGGARMISLDVTSDESVKACLDHVIREAGRIDVLVNNAGYLLSGAIEDATLVQAKALFEVNFFGIVRMVKAALPFMRTQGQGQIINMSSLAGIVPVPFWGFYNASKFAVEGYTETLRLDLQPLHIGVSQIEPGAIKTAFYKNDQSPAEPMSAYSPWRERGLRSMQKFENNAPGPEVVAQCVLRIIESKAPALRYKITKEALIFTIMRRFLPDSAFEKGIRIGFNLDNKKF